jgi:hypothetical protein
MFKSLVLITSLTTLGLLALFLGAASPARDEAGVDGVALAGSLPVQAASDTRVPDDFLPEQIRLPEFPDPDELTREQSDPMENEQDTRSAGLSLAALKVDTVAFHAPRPVQMALTLPDAPDQLTPGTISMSGFGNRGRTSREGGWGGVGVGEVGIGRVGGGTCGRNPSGPNPIVERRTGFPR